MATDLTFSPGFVPGLPRTPRRAARKRGLHAAAPVSPPAEPAAPMTTEQRRALAMLIHTPHGTRDLRFTRDRTGSSFVWAVVAACALGWTLTIAAALLPESKAVRTVDATHVAMPHVTEPQRA